MQTDFQKSGVLGGVSNAKARGEVDDLYVHCKREEAAARAAGDWGKFYYSDGQWLPVHK
jgi:hypothetical protein